MTDPTPEEPPAYEVPEPTEQETVARLAAEAALRARPDLSQDVQSLQQSVSDILAALQQASGPEGNAAKLQARLDAVEEELAALRRNPPVHPETQLTIDNLRLNLARLGRN